MSRSYKSNYISKKNRYAKFIKAHEQQLSYSLSEATKIAWATVNKRANHEEKKNIKY